MPVEFLSDEPALSRARLAHVDQYYMRAENHAAANGVLIDAQAQIPIARAWGGGLLASVDGLRFVVPVRTINAGPSPKYFGYKRGITWLNAVNDQVAGIGQMVVPGTPRDSLFILDTLLNLDAGPKPEVVTTDNASCSDMVFGVFAILNYRFAPRFADLPDQRYWRARLPDPLPAGVDLSPEQQAIGGYRPLEPIARNTVNVAKIATQWPDMLRVAGSLVTDQVRAYDLLRMFGRDAHPAPLGQAFAEYGRTVLNAAAGWSLGHQRPSEAQTLDPLGVWVERPVALSQKSGRVTRCASHGTGVEPNSLTIRTARGVCAWTRNRCRHRLESLGERLPQYAFGT